MAEAGGLIMESVQVALFFSEPRVLELEKLVPDAFSVQPSVVERRSGGPASANLTIDEWQLALSSNPTRVDLVVSPAIAFSGGPEASGPPGTTDIGAMCNAVLGFSTKIATHLGVEVIRVGVVGAGTQSCQDANDAQEQFLRKLPFRLELSENLEDLAFQFNKKTRSAFQDISINNLHAWQVLKQQSITFGPSGLAHTENIVLRHVLDVNTAPSPSGKFDVDSTKGILAELIGLIRADFERKA